MPPLKRRGHLTQGRRGDQKGHGQFGRSVGPKRAYPWSSRIDALCDLPVLAVVVRGRVGVHRKLKDEVVCAGWVQFGLRGVDDLFLGEENTGLGLA